MKLLRLLQFLLVLFFLFVLIYSIYYYNINYNDISVLKTKLYDLSGNCTLSLCDCNCYKTSELPEIKSSKICSNDCKSRFNIIGCEDINGTCKIKFEEK